MKPQQVVRRCVVSSLIVLSLLGFSESFAQSPAIDPAATTTLKRMTTYLANQKQFSVNVQNTLEEVLEMGSRIDVDISTSVIVARPNSLYSERRGMKNQLFYYNGQELTLYSSKENIYATKPAPSTFEGLLSYLHGTLGFGVSLSDFLHPDAYSLLMEDVSFAAVIGKTYIDGIKCDHLLFRRPGVQFQVWVAEGDTPLPYKYVVMDTEFQGNITTRSTMTNWNFNIRPEESQFTFTPPEGATKIDFMAF